MSLHFNLPDRYIHIHSICNPVNSEEVSTSIPILKRRLAAYPNKEHIILGDFNLHHKVWGGPRASSTLIEKIRRAANSRSKMRNGVDGSCWHSNI